MKTRIENYTFNASDREITFTDYVSIDLNGILIIVNVTDNIIIYNFAVSGLGGTVTDNILTLEYDTSGFSNTDDLLIYYDDLTITQEVEVNNLPADYATLNKQDELLEIFSLEKYKFTNATDIENVTYIGAIDGDGNWLIKKIDKDDENLTKYAVESNNPTYDNYVSAWTDKASLTYDYYNLI
jgi:hypothetical protein